MPFTLECSDWLQNGNSMRQYPQGYNVRDYGIDPATQYETLEEATEASRVDEDSEGIRPRFHIVFNDGIIVGDSQ